MKFLKVGKFTNTHGIKGEIRILSDFRFKKLEFKDNMILYIGEDKKEFIISNHRQHKNYDLLMFKDINNINQIKQYKGEDVYINKDTIELVDNLKTIDKLIGYKVYCDNKLLGYVIEFTRGVAHDVLVVGDKRILIPYVKEYVLDICSLNKIIYIKNVRGIIDED